MAKKASGTIGGASSTSPQSEKPAAKTVASSLRLEKSARAGEKSGHRPDTTHQKPSSLLDTHVVYCGDNPEQPGRMQKEERRMMKPARFPILHSSFILLNFPVATSHYVKVMRIFGEN